MCLFLRFKKNLSKIYSALWTLTQFVRCYGTSKNILLKYMPTDHYWKQNVSILQMAHVNMFCSSVCLSFWILLYGFHSYHCHLYPHPETDEERADVMDSLRTRIQDLQNVRLLLLLPLESPYGFDYRFVLCKIMLTLSHSLEDWHNYLILLFHN